MSCSYIFISHGETAAAVSDKFKLGSTLPWYALTNIRNWISGIVGGSYNGKAYVGVDSATAWVNAKGTLTLSGNPSNTETMVLGKNTITAVTSGATGLQFNIGADAAATCTNIAALINTNTTLNVLFSASATATTVVITCLIPGAIGNQITFTEAMTNVTADGYGYLGGTTAGTGGTDSSPVTYAISLA